MIIVRDSQSMKVFPAPDRADIDFTSNEAERRLNQDIRSNLNPKYRGNNQEYLLGGLLCSLDLKIVGNLGAVGWATVSRHGIVGIRGKPGSGVRTTSGNA